MVLKLCICFGLCSERNFFSKKKILDFEANKKFTIDTDLKRIDFKLGNRKLEKGKRNSKNLNKSKFKLNLKVQILKSILLIKFLEQHCDLIAFINLDQSSRSKGNFIFDMKKLSLKVLIKSL